MSIQLGPIVLNPGVPVSIPIRNIPGVTSAKLSNGSPFDLSVSGFGFQGTGTVPAGTEYMLDATVENSGAINILPVNNVGASGNGIANLDVYIRGETPPKGTWPITIPAQVVQAKVSTVTTLINDGNAAGTQIIESSPAGQTSTTSVTNDGLWVLKTLIGGVLHQFLKTQNAGNLLQLVQAGDTAEILGALVVDQLTTMSGNATVGGTLGVTGNTTLNGGVNVDTIRDNGAGNPAMDLSSHDGVVRFPQPIRLIPKVATLNGSTSGTYTIYEFCAGPGATDLKFCVCVSNNFRNGGASVQSLALPVAFQSFARMWFGDHSVGTLTKAGVAQGVGTITSMPATNASGGTVSVGTVIAAYVLDDIGAGFDTVTFNSGQASAHTGVDVFIGI